MSGYSKQQHAELLEKYLVSVIEPYKKIKKAPIVDNTTVQFKGLKIKSHLNIINGFLMKNMILV